MHILTRWLMANSNEVFISPGVTSNCHLNTCYKNVGHRVSVTWQRRYQQQPGFDAEYLQCARQIRQPLQGL